MYSSVKVHVGLLILFLCSKILACFEFRLSRLCNCVLLWCLCWSIPSLGRRSYLHFNHFIISLILRFGIFFNFSSSRTFTKLVWNANNCRKNRTMIIMICLVDRISIGYLITLDQLHAASTIILRLSYLCFIV